MRWAVRSLSDGAEEEPPEAGRWVRLEWVVERDLDGEGVRGGEPISAGNGSEAGGRGGVSTTGSGILGNGPTSQSRRKGAYLNLIYLVNIA